MYPADAIKCPGCGQPNEEIVCNGEPSSTDLNVPYDGLVWSIIVTGLFFPTGLAAIIYSMKVDYFWFKGERDYAVVLAQKARTYRLISVGIFFGLILLFLIIGALR